MNVSDEELRNAIDEVVKACQNMSKARVGALIIIAPTKISSHILEKAWNSALWLPLLCWKAF